MKFVITIGREYGSGGRFIGRELAKKLNVNFYDNDLLIKVSEESGLCLEYVKEYDEKKDSFFTFMASGDAANSLSAVQKVTNAQFAAIKNLAQNESCVIVGRCADYVLRDEKNVLNVFISATMEDKIFRATRYYNLSEKKARENIDKINKKRAVYYAYFTDQKWGEAKNYDLCINSSIGIAECVDIIIDFAKKKFPSIFKE